MAQNWDLWEGPQIRTFERSRNRPVRQSKGSIRLPRRRVPLNLYGGRHAWSRSPPFSFALLLLHGPHCSILFFVQAPALCLSCFHPYCSRILSCLLTRRGPCRLFCGQLSRPVPCPSLIIMPRQRQNIIQLAKKRGSDKESSFVNNDRLLPRLQDGTLRSHQSHQDAWEEYV
jgi:hypothetical protein